MGRIDGFAEARAAEIPDSILEPVDADADADTAGAGADVEVAVVCWLWLKTVAAAASTLLGSEWARRLAGAAVESEEPSVREIDEAKLGFAGGNEADDKLLAEADEESLVTFPLNQPDILTLHLTALTAGRARDY